MARKIFVVKSVVLTPHLAQELERKAQEEDCSQSRLLRVAWREFLRDQKTAKEVRDG